MIRNDTVHPEQPHIHVGSTFVAVLGRPHQANVEVACSKGCDTRGSSCRPDPVHRWPGWSGKAFTFTLPGSPALTQSARLRPQGPGLLGGVRHGRILLGLACTGGGTPQWLTHKALFPGGTDALFFTILPHPFSRGRAAGDRPPTLAWGGGVRWHPC